jgi:rhamnose utilization protein RhaD (predicted bifunctional aldolase and dehydrogenase)/NAD(P)-dependent dehydrogenase (short-subunit alcohol dehydrogenase family)
MTTLWDDNEAKKYKTDLDLRVYTSRLLGQDSSLVLHGGGNTSVKSSAKNLFGETENILYVKGSGWDLATIESEGFAPVKMDMLLKMAKLDKLNDPDMVKYQRLAMTNPSAPNPSVEAILHAIIPFKFVDHTHADAVVTITNTQNGEQRIKELYGENVLIIPYIMPGFVLAKLIYDMTKNVDWSQLDGLVLMNHGLFTFNDDAKASYEKTIELVDKAEQYLVKNGATLQEHLVESDISLLELAQIRKQISLKKGHATISILNESSLAMSFSNSKIEEIATQGPLTPDHVIRTKRTPLLLSANIEADLNSYIEEYTKYFDNNKTNETLLNPTPNFAILCGEGSLSFGKNAKEANIIKDINEHTFEAILKAEKLGGYKALSASKIFEVEYWSLEQAKLKKSTSSLEFSGQVALVTSGTSGIGLATVKMLNTLGATVVVLDTNPEVETIFNKTDVIGIKCDLTSSEDIQKTIETTVKNFGGIDIVVSNIEISTPSETLEVLSDVNLIQHQQLIKQTMPFLELGVNPSIVMVASNNFENGASGVRVNAINPTVISDTTTWTNEISKSWAKAYNNASKSEIKFIDVAKLVCAMAGSAFAKTIDSQVVMINETNNK